MMPLMHVYYRSVPGIFGEKEIDLLVDEACASASAKLATNEIALSEDDFFVIIREFGPLDRSRCDLLVEINLHDVPERTVMWVPDHNARLIANQLARKAAELIQLDMKIGVWLMHGNLGWAKVSSHEE